MLNRQRIKALFRWVWAMGSSSDAQVMVQVGLSVVQLILVAPNIDDVRLSWGFNGMLLGMSTVFLFSSPCHLCLSRKLVFRLVVGQVSNLMGTVVFATPI
eukprot:jgi/Botrbrau1/4028/Bobra.0016s0035.1